MAVIRNNKKFFSNDRFGINQVSIRYNIKVNKEKQSSRCLNDDCSDKTLYCVAARCEYEHALLLT